MQKRYIFLFIAAILLTLFVLYSCNGPYVVENKKIEKQEKPVLKKETNDEGTSEETLLNKRAMGALETGTIVKRKDIIGKEIGPKKPACDYKVVEEWYFEKYTEKDNKMLGIWPESNVEFATPSEYRHKWGFSGIVIPASNQSNYNAIADSGYPKENIIVALPSYSTLTEVYSKIDLIHSEKYYLDEPLERNYFNINDLIDVANHITDKYPSSMLIISSYKMPYGWYAYPVYTFGQAYGEVLNFNANVRMMCDQYSNSIQKSMWDQFKSSYGNKYYGNFIASKDNYGDYSNLISKANNIGINNLFLYHGSWGWPTKTPEFCNDAWRNGWLREYYRKYINTYRCYEPDPCINCADPDAPWYLYKSVKTDVLREVYP